MAEAEAAIREGRVWLDGRVVRQPLAPVRAQSVVKLDGHKVELSAPTLVLAFHKPAGTVTSAVGQAGAPTVFEVLLPSLPPGLARHHWHAVGRLDKGTTGLLLFTNDEQVVAHVTAPSSKLPKRYVATVGSLPTEERLAPLRHGLKLSDGVARALSARVLPERRVEITLTEGRHHQVKRMLGEVGLPVLALHREAIGRLELGEVAPGGFRLLSPEEVARGLGFPPGAR